MTPYGPISPLHLDTHASPIGNTASPDTRLYIGLMRPAPCDLLADALPLLGAPVHPLALSKRTYTRVCRQVCLRSACHQLMPYSVRTVSGTGTTSAVRRRLPLWS